MSNLIAIVHSPEGIVESEEELGTFKKEVKPPLSSIGRRPSFSPDLLETLKRESKIETREPAKSVGEPEKRLLCIVDTVSKKSAGKTKLTDLALADSSETLAAKLQMTTPRERGEIKANHFSRSEKVLMSQFTASRAIAIMGSTRRRRREQGEQVGWLQWQETSWSTIQAQGGLNTVGLMAVSKLKFKLDRTRKLTELPDIGFNSKVLIGLSRFKKKIGLKSSLESTPREEELDDDHNKMRFC